MPLQGKQILPRDFAAACAVGWPGDELPKAVATGWSESALYVGAYNDNLGPNGQVASRDVGILEINIPASEIGTDVEFDYRTVSSDPTVYEPIIAASVKKAKAIYEQPWTRNGKADIRRWEAWFGYTEGWAMFPASWSWHQVNGEPVGPWQKTGRYIHKAIVGCANYHLLIAKDKTLAQAVSYAEAQWKRFNVDGSPGPHGSQALVTFFPPPQPTEPPKDKIGPRPVPNNGL